MKWIRKKDGKRRNFRVGKVLDTYRVPQGACSDGTYFYIAYEQKKPQKIRIVKYKVDGLKLVKISKPLSLGHANDMTIVGNTLYVTHSGTSKKIHTVNATTLQKEKDIKVSGGLSGFNGITKEGSGFLLRVMGGRSMLITDKNFKKKSSYKCSVSLGVSQGVTSNDKYVIRSWAHSNPTQSKKNFVAYYNRKGKLIKKKHLPITGELESVFFVGKELWCTVYRKKIVEGKKEYYTFILRDV